MYEAFFGLRSRPFNPLPRVDSYVALTPTRDALDGLVRCVEQDRGIGVLTSPAGTGKSLVCRLLQAHFADQRRTVLLTTGRFPTRRALLQAILFEMKHPYVGLSEQEARLRLLDLLQSSPAPLNRMLLIVDEAHLLSPKGHEELRTLTDCESNGIPLVSLVLSGQLELEETLAEPGMNALNQRVGCHVSIEPLTIEESYEYIRERFRMAGNVGLTIFTPEALYLICTASEGNPRRLNQLCDHSLLLAYAEGSRPVDAAVVRSALLDLRELPLHWNSPLDLSDAKATNPLEAFAESHAAEAGEATFLDDEIPDPAPESPTETDLAPAEPSAVYEVGGDTDNEAEGEAISQLFQTEEFILPPEVQEEDESSFSQILREPLAEISVSELMGAFETTPDPVDGESDLTGAEAAINEESTLQTQEVQATDADAGSEQEATTEIKMDAEFEEAVIDDIYADIDRLSETMTPRPLVAPSLPPLTAGCPSCTAKAHDSHCEATEEQQILNLVHTMTEEVQQARQEPAAESVSCEKPRVIEPAQSHFQSLRQTLSWQFDVVEPESDAAIPSMGNPIETPQPHPVSVAQVKPATDRIEESDDAAPDRRYAQLFTRLQKQRRRVEAVMNRERRTGSEARAS